MRRRNKGEERDIALKRIRKLFAMAQGSTAENRDLSDRYVRLARRIGMRYQVSMPTDLRRRVCRGCESLLVPGRTARVRVASGRVSVTCLRCETVKRYPYRGGRKVTA